MRNLSLTEIWIYPIKSLGGVRLKTAKVEEKGLVYDRRWMLVDEDWEFLTQRLIPRMALFKVSLEPTGLLVTFERDTIQVPYSLREGTSVQAVIWDDIVEVIELSDRFGNWFSERLGRKCRLVCFPEENTRLVDQAYQINKENVSLADAFPLLIIGEMSLADLNRRLAEPLPMNRFRPNLVFSGGEPYEEDGWRNFRIKDNRFVGVKPCARCTIPTVDQVTGISGKEPLKTLAGYRRSDAKVLFGQNVIAIDHGEISEGDVIVLE